MKLLISIIFFPCIFLFNNPLQSQGFNSISMSNSSAIVTAGDSGKVYLSHDEGLSWERLTSPIVNFNCVSTRNYVAFLTAGDSKVYKTVSFVTVSERLIPGNHKFKSVFFISDSAGYVCGENGAVFRTTNAGNNWSVSNTGISTVHLNSISFKDNNNGVAAGDSGNIFITSNGGSSWVKESTGSIKNILKVKYFSDGIVASGGYGALLLKSNKSLIWESVDTRISADIRGITGSGINDVHICGGGGFIRNNKFNNNNFTNFEANPMMCRLTDIAIKDSKVGLAVSSQNRAVIKTTDGGVSWHFLQGVNATYKWERKISSTLVLGNPICRHPYDRNTFFCGLGNEIFVSRNNGEDWTNIAEVPGSIMQSLYISPLDTNIWVCAITGSPDRIARTSNYGANWTVSIALAFSTFGQPLEMDQNNPSVFYFAPDDGGFYKSTDNGNTFISISDFPFLSPCEVIVMWDSSEVILVGDAEFSGGKIYRSTNSGVNWSLILDDSTGAEIPSMANSIFEKNVIYSTEAGQTFFRSTDYGESFSPFFELGFANWASAVCEEDPTLIMDGMYSNTCYFSLNRGEDWLFSNGVGNFAGLGLLAPSKDNILYMTTDGVYKLKVTYTGIVSVRENIISSRIPDKFLLYQNYPNPFNPSTTIKFEIPKSGNISLKVFDQLGKEVMTLINGMRSAGTYEVNFDASSLSSGLYFYRLVSDKTIITKKMIVVK